MKRVLVLALAALLIAALAAFPQSSTKHRVVFQMNTPSQDAWNQLFGNIENIRTAFAPQPVEIEVVAYGKGINLLLKTNAEFEERIKAAAASGVVFGACQNTMRMRKLTMADIFSISTAVDSGVAELVRKQEAGWSLVKVSE